MCKGFLLFPTDTLKDAFVSMCPVSELSKRSGERFPGFRHITLADPLFNCGQVLKGSKIIREDWPVPCRCQKFDGLGSQGGPGNYHGPVDFGLYGGEVHDVVNFVSLNKNPPV